MRLLSITFLVFLLNSFVYLHGSTSSLPSLGPEVENTSSIGLHHSAQFFSSSSIVVVDIIPAYNFNDSGTSRSHESHATSDYEPNEKVTLELDINDPGTYHISGKSIGANPEVEFNFILMYLPTGDLFVGNSVDHSSNFDIVGDGPAFGKFQSNASSNWINLFQIKNEWARSGGIDAVITWLEDIEATITYSVNYGQGNPQSFAVNPNTGATATQDILPEVYPNPVQDILHWNAPSSGRLEIYDMAGRQWFDGEITEEDHSLAQISVANWPNGSYILRWMTTENIPQTKHFVKTE